MGFTAEGSTSTLVYIYQDHDRQDHGYIRRKRDITPNYILIYDAAKLMPSVQSSTRLLLTTDPADVRLPDVRLRDVKYPPG